jgi:hypothetical protein
LYFACFVAMGGKVSGDCNDCNLFLDGRRER